MSDLIDKIFAYRAYTALSKFHDKIFPLAEQYFKNEYNGALYTPIYDIKNMNAMANTNWLKIEVDKKSARTILNFDAVLAHEYSHRFHEDYERSGGIYLEVPNSKGEKVSYCEIRADIDAAAILQSTTAVASAYIDAIRQKGWLKGSKFQNNFTVDNGSMIDVANHLDTDREKYSIKTSWLDKILQGDFGNKSQDNYGGYPRVQHRLRCLVEAGEDNTWLKKITKDINKNIDTFYEKKFQIPKSGWDISK